MKNHINTLKFMSAAVTAFCAMFTAAYIRGIYVCTDIYAMLDSTLPFAVMLIISFIGFWAANAKCCMAEAEYDESCARARRLRRARISRKAKKAVHDRRHIIVAYDRNGIHKKPAALGYSRSMAKSA